MDIACPHCAATYRVPESLVAGGRALRCAACGQEWVPQAPPSAPVDEPASQPPEAVIPEGAPSPALVPAGLQAQARVPQHALVAAWIASLAAVVLGLAALVVFREPIAAAWPPFARLGNLLGS